MPYPFDGSIFFFFFRVGRHAIISSKVVMCKEEELNRLLCKRRRNPSKLGAHAKRFTVLIIVRL